VNTPADKGAAAAKRENHPTMAERCLVALGEWDEQGADPWADVMLASDEWAVDHDETDRQDKLGYGDIAVFTDGSRLTWHEARKEWEADKVTYTAYKTRDEYIHNTETTGYMIYKAAKGWVVGHSSQIQGELTGDKYLVPYGTMGLGKDTDLRLNYNDCTSNGAAIWEAACTAPNVRVLHKGHLVR